MALKAFDIDGVLANFQRAFCHELILRGVDLPDDYEPTYWHEFEKEYKKESDDVWDRITNVAPWWWLGVPPYRENVEAVRWALAKNELSGSKDIFVYLTARGHHPGIIAPTMEWLNRKGLWRSNTTLLVPVKYQSVKVSVAQKMGIESLVDDHPETVITARMHGLKGYMQDRQWNRGLGANGPANEFVVSNVEEYLKKLE